MRSALTLERKLEDILSSGEKYKIPSGVSELQKKYMQKFSLNDDHCDAIMRNIFSVRVKMGQCHCELVPIMHIRGY